VREVTTTRDSDRAATDTSDVGSSAAVGRRADGRLTLAARLGLVVVGLAVLLSALDQYVVVTTLAPITRDVGISFPIQIDRAFWIVNAYILGYIVAMPLMGRVSDLYGRRRIFTLCLALFALGSLFCALAPVLGDRFPPDYTTLDGVVLTPLYTATRWLLDLLARLGIDTTYRQLDVLVGARFVQAVGGGALVPVGIAVVGDLFGGARRGLALGMIGAAAEAGGVLGPLWGVQITALWGWRWIFYLNIPLAALLLVAGAFTLPRGHHSRGRVDYVGALLFGAFLVCLSLGIGLQGGFNLQLGQGSAAQQGSFIQPNPWLLLAAAGLLVVFVALELPRRSPALDVRLFRRRAFSSAALLSLLTGATLVVPIALLPYFIDYLQPSSGPLDGALVLLRMMALIPVGALLGGWLASRLGCPPAAVLGTLLSAAGLFLMSRWPADVGGVQITLATTVTGLGFGLVIAPISTSALNSSGARQTGMGGAIVTVLRMTGMLLGVTWLTPWAEARLTTLLAQATDPSDPTTVFNLLHQVFSEVFLIAAALALLAVVPALLLWRRGQAQGADQAAPAGEEHAYAGLIAPPS
jgi:MFS family permease